MARPATKAERIIPRIIEVLIISREESAQGIADICNFNYYDGQDHNLMTARDVNYGADMHRKYPGRFATGQIVHVRNGRAVRGNKRWQYLPDFPSPEERFQKSDERRDQEMAGTVSAMRHITSTLVRKAQQWEVVERYEISEAQRRDLRRARSAADFFAQTLTDIADRLAV